MDPITALPTASGLGAVKAAGADEERALRAFDAYFVGEMLKRSSPQNPSGLLDGGQAGRMYQDHLYQEFARIIAENTDFGVTSTLRGHLGPAGDDAAQEAGDPERLRVTGKTAREEGQ